MQAVNLAHSPEAMSSSKAITLGGAISEQDTTSAPQVKKALSCMLLATCGPELAEAIVRAYCSSCTPHTEHTNTPAPHHFNVHLPLIPRLPEVQACLHDLRQACMAELLSGQSIWQWQGGIGVQGASAPSLTAI